MKYLIAGLGNIGDEYRNSRHNIGFMVLDALAEASNTVFEDKRYGAQAIHIYEFKWKCSKILVAKRKYTGREFTCRG